MDPKWTSYQRLVAQNYTPCAGLTCCSTRHKIVPSTSNGINNNSSAGTGPGEFSKPPPRIRELFEDASVRSSFSNFDNNFMNFSKKSNFLKSQQTKL